jgi:hypothetical protein
MLTKTKLILIHFTYLMRRPDFFAGLVCIVSNGVTSYAVIMKNLIRLTSSILILGLLTSCASYKPIVDTAGRSGTFDKDKAKEISNDLQHCKQIAKDNTSTMSNISFWFLSPTAQTQYEDIYRKCMINRGHSVLN